MKRDSDCLDFIVLLHSELRNAETCANPFVNQTLKDAIERAKLGEKERIGAIKRLGAFVV